MTKAKTSAAKPAAGKAVARTGTTALVDNALMAQLAAESGAGFEEAGRDAFAIPFLYVLQDLSPQVKKKMAGYIEGAQPGMFYNSVSREVSEELRVVPCYFSQAYIEWIPRGNKEGGKGGFVAAHPATTPLVNQGVRDGGKLILPNGHELQDTRQHFLLVVNEDGTTNGCLLPLKSTQIKVSRRWMSQMKAQVIPHPATGQLIIAPSYGFSYLLTTEEEANDDGSWYSIVVSDPQPMSDPNLLAQARAFHASMKQGSGKVLDEIHSHEAARDGGGRGPGEGFSDMDNEIDA